MYLRLIGAISLFLGASYFGFSAAFRVRREVRTLHQLKQSLDIMRCEISYTMTPFSKLCDILVKSTQKEVSAFYANLKTILENDSAEAAGSVQRYFPMLSAPTAEAMRALTVSFGRFGAQEQLRLIDAASIQVEQELARVSEEREHRAKCYRTLGICTGLAIAILVL